MLRVRAAGASANEFQASHAGQRPSQRSDSWPHAEQKKTDRGFAIEPEIDGRSRRDPPHRGARLRRERRRLAMGGFAHVAIDGPAGSGKTTVARALARRLGILYLDTGAMYRAVAWLALTSDVDPSDERRVVRLVGDRPIVVTPDERSDAGFRVSAGDRELADELYDPAVSRTVSLVAAHPRVREALVARQRAIAALGPVVMAGRDIGTVVLPDAPHKIFLTATLDERVARRAAELAARGLALEPGELRRELVERDRLDASRPVAPLRAAADAVEIDSTGSTVDEVVERIVALAGAVAPR